MDISPHRGVQLAGHIGKPRPAELVREPIYARAVVFQDDHSAICLVSTDLPLITRPYVDQIRQQAASSCGLKPGAIMVHAVQNHAAPSIGHSMMRPDSPYVPAGLEWLRGGDDSYIEFAVPRIVEAIQQAWQRCEPVAVGWGATTENAVAFCRRFVMRDGRVVTHPSAAECKNILRAESPIDPELGVLAVVNMAGRVVAVIMHYTCHPVHGLDGRQVISGWPGAWSRNIRQSYGPQCVPLLLNGFCGNIHHHNHLDPDYRDDHQQMGNVLADDTRRAMTDLTWMEAPIRLDAIHRELAIPYREIPDSQVQAARQLLCAHPEPLYRSDDPRAISWDWCYALSLVDLVEMIKEQPTCPVEVQALRLGDLAVIGVPGEPFVEAQLEIKGNSPALRTFCVHMANGAVGYIPTAEALSRGGYETRTAHWSKLSAEALDTITYTATELLEELFCRCA